MPVIRPARPGDSAAIAEIYNAGIADGGATFEIALRTADEMARRIDAAAQFPIVVAEDDTHRVAGWAAVSEYRGRACYAGVAEFSFYVAREARGRGLGSTLLAGLVAASRDAGFWKLVSRVFPSNVASLAACRRAGFREVGRYEKHGFGDGRWQDVVIVERLIPENQSPSGLRFRHARAEDWPAISALLKEASLPVDGARAQLGAFVLALRNNEPVGCATVERAGEPDVLLRSVALRASERGTGAGRLLVERTLGRAAGQGARSAVLLTTTAEAFFLRLGFAKISRAEVPATLRNSPEFTGVCPASAIVMQREIRLDS